MLMVEPVRQDDLQQVAGLAGQQLSEWFPARWLAAQAAANADTFLVARELRENTIVGFVVGCKQEPCEGKVLAIAVDNEHRGQGLGTALLRNLRSQMARHGAYRLTLEVRADDPRAQRFYMRHGFTPDGLLEHQYSDGGDALRLVRPL